MIINFLNIFLNYKNVLIVVQKLTEQRNFAMKLKYSIAHTFVYVIFILTFLKFCFYIKSEPAQQQYTSQLKSTKVFCSSATLDKCLDHWFQMSEDPGKAFPITYDDLENTCV